GLARDHRDIGDRSFRERVQQLGALANDAAVFLLRAGKESGDVLEGDERDVEAIAEAHKAPAFHRRVDVKDAGQNCRLVGHDPHRPPIKPGKPDNDVFGVMLVYFEKQAGLDYAVTNALDVLGQVELGGADAARFSAAR